MWKLEFDSLCQYSFFKGLYQRSCLEPHPHPPQPEDVYHPTGTKTTLHFSFYFVLLWKINRGIPEFIMVVLILTSPINLNIFL